ncbi:MAG: hypothetical protein F4139_12120 [Gemmatimonadetes bacterium]|nr:hypothetical protein [Gemmatimonadota bacterium]MYA63631.1 hypothetical protein [Gemmatimonadota bacterium]MYB99097.1 hypothetical protein [Gemmatimonadota bacterium]MYH53666.1 hypothetical protein [Gemmatimonadota bacterium]MYI44898.1 hypothetical protein [Gemmatimonadota bacterium]
MRRYGTEVMAIGAILAGAAIGATGTLALVGNPFEANERVAFTCESISLPGTAHRATWTYTVARDGEILRKKCPRRLTTRIHLRRAPMFDPALQEELAATASALAAARTELEVVRVLERRKAEAAETAGNR